MNYVSCSTSTAQHQLLYVLHIKCYRALSLIHECCLGPTCQPARLRATFGCVTFGCIGCWKPRHLLNPMCSFVVHTHTHTHTHTPHILCARTDTAREQVGDGVNDAVALAKVLFPLLLLFLLFDLLLYWPSPILFSLSLSLSLAVCGWVRG